MKTRLTFYQVAARYDVVVSTLYAWVRREWIIPYHKIGNRSFWYAEDLDVWELADCPRPCDQKKKEAENEQIA